MSHDHHAARLMEEAAALFEEDADDEFFPQHASAYPLPPFTHMRPARCARLLPMPPPLPVWTRCPRHRCRL
ncbi:MAG: hypothetical protein EOO41_05565 [Methanobacteriota archaeon]|nr:MAG: hypothetical protein EOO41_05565 [Euryarchaeota archaeon]